MSVPLDTAKAERKVWIVRVPPYVAQQWHAAIAQSETAAVDEHSQQQVLGQITLEQGVATTLQVPGSDGTTSQVLHMNGNRDTVDTNILSYEPVKPAAAKAGAAAPALVLKDPRVDGVVHKRYDAAPVKIADVPGGARAGLSPEGVRREAEQRQRGPQSHVDASYLENSRRRMAAAASGKAAGKRGIQIMEDTTEVIKLGMGTNHQLYTFQKEKKNKPTQPQGQLNRRIRMDRDQLEAELLSKFEKAPHWHFTQLQKELDQPVAYLKEVLNDMCVQIKRGPNKDLWELKKHLQTAATQQASAAAAR